VLELLSYFEPADAHAVRAVPGSGLRVPVYILGSSLFGAQVAAAMGLPFAFASHFAAQQMIPAVRIYREQFRTSPVAQIDRPYVMLGVNIITADTDEQARWLASSAKQASVSLRSGAPIKMPPPSEQWAREVTSFDASRLASLSSISFVGSPQTVGDGLHAFCEAMQPDELIVLSQIYDHAARLRSCETAAGLLRQAFVDPASSPR
jgi:luciferase family oxidoreductase group 1